MDTLLLSPQRRVRVFSVGFAAAVTLYASLALIAEPMRALGATTDTETAIVQITLAAAIGMNCDADGGGAGSGETLALAGITDFGDTGPLNATVTIGTNAVRCNVRTNNTTGYTIGWKVISGTGGGKTGHMISQFEDLITPFNYAAGISTADTTPTAWNGGTMPANSVSAWGGRLSSASTGFANNNPLNWGDNGADGTEKWMKVTTGATVTIFSPDDATSDTGDNIDIGFRVEVGSDKIQPTGTYVSTVQFTASTQ